MKKFEFRLERVLDWRRTLLRSEISRLDRIRADLARTAEEEAAWRRSLEESGAELRGRGSATGAELAAHDAYRRHAAGEAQRLGIRRRQLQQQSAQQALVVMHREREVKLIEKLRERRWRAWTAEQEAEILRQAEETFLARWRQIQ